MLRPSWFSFSAVLEQLTGTWAMIWPGCSCSYSKKPWSVPYYSVVGTSLVAAVVDDLGDLLQRVVDVAGLDGLTAVEFAHGGDQFVDVAVAFLLVVVGVPDGGHELVVAVAIRAEAVGHGRAGAIRQDGLDVAAVVVQVLGGAGAVERQLRDDALRVFVLVFEETVVCPLLFFGSCACNASRRRFCKLKV